MNKPINCLIIDDMHPSIVKMLEEIGIRPDYRPDITREEILSVIGEYEGIIVRSKVFFGPEFIDKATKLRFLGRAGAGLDNLDVEALTKKNIILLNAPEGNRDALAEQAAGMLLALMNNVLKSDQEVRNGIWDREGNRGYELMGKTIGLIGYGYMGKATAKRLKGFDCKIMAYDKYHTGYGDAYAEACSMEDIYREADILSLHVPLTAETRFMITESYLKPFAKPIWFMNTARGEIVKLSELVKALESGKIRGAALDVLENEKLKTFTTEQQKAFDYLKKSPKVLLTPHVGGWTFESYKKINEVLVEKIKNMLKLNSTI